MNAASNARFPPALLAEIQQHWLVQDYGRALTLMEEHWRSAPQDPVSALHYATILGHCARFLEARALLDELVASAAPAKRLWALGSAGMACCDFQRFDWAADFMCRAAGEPDPPAEVFYRLGESLERLNRLPEAVAAIDDGLSRFRRHPGLLLLYARLARRDGALEKAERVARDVIAMPEAAPDIRCQAGYELGHALDAQDRCAEAYAAFIAAKMIQQPRAETFRHVWRTRMQLLRSTENLPTAEEFRRWAQASRTPTRRHALLVGCPRSGTTLLERMLGSHEQVVSSSESIVWRNTVWMPLLHEFAAASSMRAVLANVSTDQLEAAHDRYWRSIVHTVKGEVADRLLLDKNPSIFPELAGAVRVFPEAHVLVALRDPRDIVWSCFTQALPVNIATSAFVRLESTAEQVAAELEQWFRLRPRLATPWLEVSYEALVKETEANLRRVLAFLGLAWSAEVLSFHERGDPVASPTYADVVRPVHRAAVGRWRRYAALIEPLETRLGEAIREVSGLSASNGYKVGGKP